MYLNQLSYSNFRGLEDKKIDLDKNFNLIYGKNGQGKTSFIEAVHFLATGKSFRTKKTREVLRYNSNRVIVFGKYTNKNNDEKTVAIDVNEDKKDFYINRNKNKYIDYVGLISIISFIPEDLELIVGNPGVRRNFFNYEISQAKKEYLRSIVEFEKILKIRNKLIKEKKETEEIYEIYNEKFIEEGTNIIIYRREFIKNISILLNLNYRKLFDPKSELKLKYECFLGDIDKKSREELKNKFIDQCKRKKEREKMLGYSLLGPQKDDFIFKLNDKNAKSYSSQGEKKSIIFSLKISEIDILVKEKNEYPIFIMDDVSSYFDEIRKKSILDYFINKKIQCFITSTEDLNIKGKKIIIDKGKVILE
ncbi:MAG: DNA replication/repair protein RecF [Leptotrichiaceae bacterium]|nr:DNA replication/repair protein RecF [Leptotrichiaceae bacterium]MBP6281478.1 DNA replication/repair protein RecF [Leptotrichiaceae bacterium]MBP7101147.1 DNA replication/repair protein RecF [Leptotrichiaceae bacterium]MBP7725544.1 DNA replication/repair protein RecF [Leptotrichiaceae bacterium]MBP9630117.1 DNA replication/repair protein RecF [Leptotrichiaceae bacterium]